MKETLHLLNEEDWAVSCRSNNNNLERLKVGDKVRNLALALVSSGYYELFKPIKFVASFFPINSKEITSESDPSDIKLKFECDLFNGRDYSIALHWFLIEKSDDVFSLEHCCNVIGMNIGKVRDRVEFIKNCRETIKETVSDKVKYETKTLNDVLNKLETTKKDLLILVKNRFLSMKKSKTPEQFPINFTKQIQIADKLKSIFNNKFDLEKNNY